VAEGGQIAAGGDGDFALGIMAVSGWSGWLVRGGSKRYSCRFLGPVHGATLPTVSVTGRLRGEVFEGGSQAQPHQGCQGGAIIWLPARVG
jgi:hypothetical protein